MTRQVHGCWLVWGRGPQTVTGGVTSFFRKDRKINRGSRGSNAWLSLVMVLAHGEIRVAKKTIYKTITNVFT